jgi:hypothetical protein
MPRKSSREIVQRPYVPVVWHDPALSAQIAEAELPGLMAAAHINAAFLAGSVGLHCAATLSRSADAAFKASPNGDLIYRDLVMAFGAVATGEVQRLAMHKGGRF